jgi:hypothetical protein
VNGEIRNKLETTRTQENKFNFSISEKTSKQQKKMFTRKLLVSDFKSEGNVTTNAVQER